MLSKPVEIFLVCVCVRARVRVFKVFDVEHDIIAVPLRRRAA